MSCAQHQQFLQHTCQLHFPFAGAEASDNRLSHQCERRRSGAADTLWSSPWLAPKVHQKVSTFLHSFLCPHFCIPFCVVILTILQDTTSKYRSAAIQRATLVMQMCSGVVWLHVCICFCITSAVQTTRLHETCVTNAARAACLL